MPNVKYHWTDDDWSDSDVCSDLFEDDDGRLLYDPRESLSDLEQLFVEVFGVWEWSESDPGARTM